jgi:alcohol dehydrogenase (cytochrome c)/quinohemoprotein ethanol dehydrogenase
MHAPKNGHFYLLEAKTGKFLSATPYTKVTWTTGIDPVSGKPTINPKARYEQIGKIYMGNPGIYGAHTWHPMSFSPKTGLVYIPTNETPFPYLADNAFEPSTLGGQLGLSAVPTPADKAVRAATRAMFTGALVAWDPIARKEAWRVPYEGPSNGGTMATAGNLVFQGTAGGDFAAYSADKGAKLWSFPAQTGIIAAPISYAIEGEQYVAILVGWGGLWDLFGGVTADKSGPTRNISRVLVFKLGAKGKLAEPPPMAKRVLDPPPVTGTPTQLARGEAVYNRYCTYCHGDAAISGGLVPDLRHSATLNNADAIRAIVIDGALKHNGMVSFKEVVTAQDAEGVRQYLIKRANQDKALEGK